MMTLPNFLTVLRMFCLPFIVLLWHHHYYEQAFYLFISACLTDFADGYLAHKMHSQSELGAFLDPLADKILVLGLAFFVLWFLPPWSHLQWPFGLMALREILIVALRLWRPLPCFASRLSAKGKTALSMVALGCIMMPYGTISSITNHLVVPIIYIALFMSFYSFFFYIYGFLLTFRESFWTKKNKKTSPSKDVKNFSRAS